MKQKQATEGKLMFLSPDVLLTHPKNLRRFYPEHQVREMADSIRAGKGVRQAMQIVPNGKAGRYFVVDGNMRLSGARLLGKDCPKLKCELVSQTQAEQLLTMLVTAKFRYDPDPISEALHYKRLMDEEGYKVPQIGQASGVSPTAIYQRMKLLELDKEIQALIGSRKLPSQREAVDALLAIPDAKARVKLAERMARDGSPVKAIVAAGVRLKAQLEEAARNAPEVSGSPALRIARQRAFGKKVAPDQSINIKKVRRAAAEMCERCNVQESSLKAHEPAWSLIAHAADETCKACDVKAVKDACKSCPGTEFLRRVILSVGEKRSGRDYE